MRATIADVARDANCSIASVSLVLNNKKNAISEEKKQEIWEAARRLNYCVNRRAASLVTKRTCTIGLIIPDNSNSFFGTICKQIELCANRRGYSVLYGNSDNNSANDQKYLRMFLEQCVDGIVIVKSASQHEEEDGILAELIKNAVLPVVLLDRIIEGLQCSAFVVDNYYGGYIATRHLLDLGHRRIGCYTGCLGVSSAKERLAGYQAALREYGAPCDERYIFEGNYQLGNEKEALHHFEEAGVTAIFAQNDIMACGLYREIFLAGKSIPKDYSIVGFDDSFVCDILTPCLSSVHQPTEQLAEKAVQELIGQIERTKPPANELFKLPPALVVRGSAVARH